MKFLLLVALWARVGVSDAVARSLPAKKAKLTEIVDPSLPPENPDAKDTKLAKPMPSALVRSRHEETAAGKVISKPDYESIDLTTVRDFVKAGLFDKALAALRWRLVLHDRVSSRDRLRLYLLKALVEARINREGEALSSLGYSRRYFEQLLASTDAKSDRVTKLRLESELLMTEVDAREILKGQGARGL